jgi:hypothetical protein
LIFDESEWTGDILWPTNSDDFKTIINGHIKGIIDLSAKSEDELHSSALLMTMAVMGRLWAYCEKAICVQHEKENSVCFAGTSEILPYLRGEASLPASVGEVPLRLQQPPPPRHPFIRSVINTSRINKWWKFPSAIAAPDVQVGMLNSLLSEFSLQQGSANLFRDCNHVLQGIRQSTKADENRHLEDLVVDQLEDLVLGSLRLDEPLAVRLAELVHRQVRPYMKLVLRDLSCLQKAKDIPRTYWGGSGAKYASRLMAYECLRRGGGVTHFDHAGTLGFLNLPEIFAAVELSTSSRYVMATNRHAELAKQTKAPDLVSAIRPVDIIGGPGFTYMHDLPLNAPSAPSGKSIGKPTVMYLSSFCNSEAKSGTHYLSQLIYQDWSLRLARTLSALPINFICKPHPDFKYPGPSHPISQFATVSNLPFETVMNEADIFVYDCLNSTTFWEAVCTDQKIICIDIGLPGPTDHARPILERRCTFIQACFDDANRLQIDEGVLEDAIFAPAPPPLPDELREILIGP